MRHIKGESQEERFASVDGILDGLKKKVDQWNTKFGKKQSTPFQTGGHSAKCQSGLVISSFKTLLDLNLENLVVELEDFPENSVGHIVLSVISDEGKERAQKYRLKGPLNCIEQEWKIERGDKITLTLLYENPKAVWATLRGSQF